MVKVGPIIASAGGAFLIIGGSVFLTMIMLMSSLYQAFGSSLTAMGLDFFIVNFSLTLIFGIIAITASILGIKGKFWAHYILVGVGAIAVAGIFIPVVPNRIIDLGVYLATAPQINLSSSLFYTDPFLVLLGGIIGIIMKEK